MLDSSTPASIIEFLRQPEIDGQFVLPLSARDCTIEDRVHQGCRNGVWLTVVAQGKIIGCRLIKFDAATATVTFSTLAIHPAYQKMGIGTALLQRSIAVSRERFSAARIVFDTWSTNQATRRLAAKFGFRKTAEIVDDAKRPHGVTSVEYELQLTESPDPKQPDNGPSVA